MQINFSDIDSVCKSLREGAEQLALCNAVQKNKALTCVIEELENAKDKILTANNADTENASARGMSAALVERLALDEKKFQSMINGIKVIIEQTDPIGLVCAGWTTPGGMQIKQVRVPLGVVAIIYESRPNVTVDAFALAYKSGNSILLRGSSSALNSNRAIVSAIQEGLKKAGSDGVLNSVCLAEPKSDHSDVTEILTAVGKIDVALPRGGAKLINSVVQNARIPVIQTGSGVCHLYVDSPCDLEMAGNIAFNAKTQRPGACNAIETILVHSSSLADFMPLLMQKFAGKVQVRADERAFACAKDSPFAKDCLVKASEDDFAFEFLDMIVAVKTVDSVEEAIDFVNTHNTKHSEAIVTNDRSHARLFQSKVDAACVYVNASTRFTDGGEFGFGAELGISTQKLHARGPMGITALTTTKFLIDGDGQIR